MIVKEVIERTQVLMYRLEKLAEEIGALDDLFESDLIDNRGPWTELGAYQFLSRARGRLSEYIWELENDLDGASPPDLEDI